MLKIFYDSLGFGLALGTSFFLFLVFIFWIAGLAGIHIAQREARRTDWRQYTAALLFFPYPIIWMVRDMIRQKRQMGQGADENAS